MTLGRLFGRERNERGALARICPPVAALSAFLNNAPDRRDDDADDPRLGAPPRAVAEPLPDPAQLFIDPRQRDHASSAPARP